MTAEARNDTLVPFTKLRPLVTPNTSGIIYASHLNTFRALDVGGERTIHRSYLPRRIIQRMAILDPGLDCRDPLGVVLCSVRRY